MTPDPQPITITGLEIVRAPHQTAQGHSVLAYFSADVGVLSFRGCLLVRTNRGGIAAWLPKLEDNRGAKLKGVTLNDEPTRHALMQAAREMYIRMGGAHADWRSRDDEEAERPATRPPAIDLPDILPPALKRTIPVKRTISEIAK